MVCLHIRKRRRRRGTNSSDTKTQRSDNSSRFNYGNVNRSSGNGNGNVPKLQRPSQTSSEFLYLGTLVNSHGGIDNAAHNNLQQNARSSGANSSAANSRKLDSPELRPLPPLGGQNYNQRRNHGSSEMGTEEDEEFYSPRGSLGGRESSIGAGSASRRAFAAVQAENFVGLCSSSSSYSSSSSASGSPVRSVSLSISPPASLSPKCSRPKSPELVAVQTAPPRAPPPPPPAAFFRDPFAGQKESRSPSLSPSGSPSPPSSTSPERVYSRSRESSQRISNFSDHILDSPVQMSSPAQQNMPVSFPSPPMLNSILPDTPYNGSKGSSPRSSNFSDHNLYSPVHISSPGKQYMPVPQPPSDSDPKPAAERISVPPPPPPPPPPLPSKQWESPRTPTPLARKIASEPPVLITPLKPISVESPTLISPIQLPSHLEPVEKEESVEAKEHSNDSGDKNEETPKPKLKPLHWDKVRASSDREMVWDQLKSSSFKYDNNQPLIFL